jgi:hypothetical protein
MIKWQGQRETRSFMTFGYKKRYNLESSSIYVDSTSGVNVSNSMHFLQILRSASQVEKSATEAEKLIVRLAS